MLRVLTPHGTHAPSARLAVASLSREARERTLAATQLGKASDRTTCRPEGVWTSVIRASDLLGSLGAIRNSAGQSRW